MSAIMRSALLALLVAAIAALVAAAPATPEDEAAVPEVPVKALKASPRYIQTSVDVQDADDNSLKQQELYYEASLGNELQLHQGVTQGEQTGQEVAAPPQQTNAPVSLGGIMSSVWDLVVSWVRGMLGLQRHDPPRMARAILGAAAGDEQCWRTTACQAGRLLRRLHEKEFVFMMMERLSPQQWKGVVKGMRRAAVDNEDCRIYECDA